MCVVCTVSLEDTLVHIIVSKICVLALLAILVGEICNNVSPVPVVPKGYIRVQMYTKNGCYSYILFLFSTFDQRRMIRFDATNQETNAQNSLIIKTK